MARIVVTSHTVRFPLGGLLSWTLQWIVGFHQLGHDVIYVEKPGWRDSCYDPTTGLHGDDCSHGVRVLGDLFARHGVGDRWCYVDAAGVYYGLTEPVVAERFRTADIFVDLTADAFGDPELTWTSEAAGVPVRVFIDGEPGYYQHRMQQQMADGRPWPAYEHYYTVGQNVGTEASSVPTAGRDWRHTWFPVVLSIFPVQAAPPDAAFTTIMSWTAHSHAAFTATKHGQKDAEFMHFAPLPGMIGAPCELALGGKVAPPVEALRSHGWRVRHAQDVTMSFEAFRDYIVGSRGEFSVCKNIYVATNSGWFGDRAAAYLACGRPVVMQDTGFSAHLPCGRGLFAVRNVDEAAHALEAIMTDDASHQRAARELAAEYLDARKVLSRFLDEVGGS